MAEVAKSIEDREFDILDINMGCPVPKVVNNGEGSALLKTPDLIEEIVRKVSSAIKKPVTVKVRIGFENEPIDIVEIAKRIEDAGAAALAVHGRTRQQYYSGTADWDTIRRVKKQSRFRWSEWGCRFSAEGRSFDKTDWLRCGHDRTCSERKSMAVQGTESLLPDRRTAGTPVGRGNP